MFFSTACRIAWREFRSSPAKFLFVVVAVAIGIAALTAVQSFAASVHSMLSQNSRQLIAADVQAQIWNLPSPDELRAIDALASSSGRLTRVTETVSMAGSSSSRRPLLISVKAVDPSAYPFYGSLKLRSGKLLAAALPTADCAVASSELMIRLHLHIGDSVRLGMAEFTVTDVIEFEPDRLASGFGPGARVIVSRGALERAGLVQFGSRAAQRFLFKLRPGVDLDAFKARVESTVPHAFLSDYRQGSPVVGRAIDVTTSFLSLMSTIALILGSIGAAIAMFSHVQQRMETIALIKAIGGRSSQVIQIYAIETIALGVTGAVVGVIGGTGIQKVFPMLVGSLFPQLPAFTANWSFAPVGVLIGTLATALFALPVLLGLRDLKPNLIFRRDVSESEKPRSWLQGISAVVILVGMTGIAVLLSNSIRVGLYFLVGVIVSFAVLLGLALALMYAMRRIVAAAGPSVPISVRHGLANLYRPGTQIRPILLALGIGVMFTATTYILQRTVIGQISAEGPGREGNVYLLDIRDSSAVLDFVAKQPGVQGKPQSTGYIVVRFEKRNGQSMVTLPLRSERRSRLGAVRITTAGEQPDTVQVTSGSWWNKGTATPLLAVSEDAVRDYQLRLGDRLTFQIAGHVVEIPVVATFRRSRRGAMSYDLVCPAEALRSFPVVYYASARVDPPQIPSLESALFERFPTVTVMNVADILGRIDQAVTQVTVVIRFMAAFSIAAGLIILGGSVASTRDRRVRETAIFKTLGASRSRMRLIFSVEFAVLGALAGLVGGLLANSLAAVLSANFLQTHSGFDWPIVAAATIGTACLAVLSATVASSGILKQKPLQILRGE